MLLWLILPFMIFFAVFGPSGLIVYV